MFTLGTLLHFQIKYRDGNCVWKSFQLCHSFVDIVKGKSIEAGNLETTFFLFTLKCFKIYIISLRSGVSRLSLILLIRWNSVKMLDSSSWKEIADLNTKYSKYKNTTIKPNLDKNQRTIDSDR